jgi:acyl carrier protein
VYFCRRNLKLIAMTEIIEKVRAIIAEKLSVDVADVTPEKSFTNDLGADSLDTVELIMEFERSFGLSIPDDQAEKIVTVGDAINFIEASQK